MSGLARATLGRLPVAGPVLASAVTGAVVEEVNRQGVIQVAEIKLLSRISIKRSCDYLTSCSQEVNSRVLGSGGDQGAEDRMEAGEEFRLDTSVQAPEQQQELSLEPDTVTSPSGRLELVVDEEAR